MSLINNNFKCFIVINNLPFIDEQLIILLLDLFMAGSETTSNNLSMAMLYMLVYPQIQQKVQNNIDLIVPHDRLPTLQDRPRYNYLISSKFLPSSLVIRPNFFDKTVKCFS